MYNTNLNPVIHPANSYAFKKELFDVFHLTWRKPEVNFAWDGTPTLIYDFSDGCGTYSVEFGRLDEIPHGEWLVIRYTVAGELWFYSAEDNGVTAVLKAIEGEKDQTWKFPEMSGRDLYNEVYDLAEAVEKVYYQNQEEIDE